MRVFSRVAIPAALIACAFALASCDFLRPRQIKLSDAITNSSLRCTCTLMAAIKGAGDIVEADFKISPRATLVAEGGEILADGRKRKVLVLARNSRIEAPGTCVLRAFQLTKTADKGPLSLGESQTGHQGDALRKLMSDPRLERGTVDPSDLKAFQIAVWAVWSESHSKRRVVGMAGRFGGPASENNEAARQALNLLTSIGWPLDGIQPQVLSAKDYLKMGDWLTRNAGTYERNKPRIRNWALWCYQMVARCKDAGEQDKSAALSGQDALKKYANVTRAERMKKGDIKWCKSRMQ